MTAPALLGKPYRPPPVKIGERVYCLYRERECRVTSFSLGRIRWPTVQPIGQRVGSGLWVSDELKRAILTESVKCLVHWFGVSGTIVWRWRKTFGVSVFGTPGSKCLHQAASERAAATCGDKRIRAHSRAKMSAANVQCDMGAKPVKTTSKRCEAGNWTPEQEAMLGTIPDADLAFRIGRTVTAVEVRRRLLGIPPMVERRRRGRPTK
jgi:hypothetical protein